MRRKQELVDGQNVSCWVSSLGKVADPYTVVYLDTAEKHGPYQVEMVQYVAMGPNPFHPQGFGQHGEMPLARVAYRGRGGAFDRRICFADLPPDCQRLVHLDLTGEDARPGVGIEKDAGAYDGAFKCEVSLSLLKRVAGNRKLSVYRYDISEKE